MTEQRQQTDLSDQFLILVSFSSTQQWGTSYSLRIFQAEDKLACILKFWEKGGIDWIEHEFDDSYIQKHDKVIFRIA